MRTSLIIQEKSQTGDGSLFTSLPPHQKCALTHNITDWWALPSLFMSTAHTHTRGSSLEHRHMQLVAFALMLQATSKTLKWPPAPPPHTQMIAVPLPVPTPRVYMFIGDVVWRDINEWCLRLLLLFNLSTQTFRLSQRMENVCAIGRLCVFGCCGIDDVDARSVCPTTNLSLFRGAS